MYFHYTSPKKAKAQQSTVNRTKRTRPMSIVASGTGNMTRMMKKDIQAMKMFSDEQKKEISRLEKIFQGNKVSISTINSFQNSELILDEDSFFGSGGDDGWNDDEANDEDSLEDDSFEMLDPSVASRFIQNNGPTMHLVNANSKRTNWKKFAKAVCGDLAFMSLNNKVGLSESSADKTHSSETERHFNKPTASCFCQKSSIEIPAISFEGKLFMGCTNS